MNDPMTFDSAAYILSQIKYRDWTIHMRRPPGIDQYCVLYFDFRWLAPDAVAHEGRVDAPLIQMQSGGHYISAFMDETQVLRKVYHAIRQAEDHETREFFRYRNVQVFDPHKPNTL